MNDEEFLAVWRVYFGNHKLPTMVLTDPSDIILFARQIERMALVAPCAPRPEDFEWAREVVSKIPDQPTGVKDD